jgi:hypothetical protein
MVNLLVSREISIKEALNGIQIVEVAPRKVMTGPWMSQFQLIVKNASSILEGL